MMPWIRKARAAIARPGLRALVALCLLQAPFAHAQEQKSGEFSYRIAPEPAFVTRRELAAAWPADAPGASDSQWRYWLYDSQVDQRGKAHVEYTEHVYEVRSQSMLGDAGRFSIDFNPEYQTLAIHRAELFREGKWVNRLDPKHVSLARREARFEQDMSDGIVTALVVLDDVRVGDVVRVAYTVEGSNPVLAGQTAEWMRMGWRNPVLDVRMRVVDDPGSDLAFHAENTALKPRIDAWPDRVELVVEAHAVAPIVDEGNYPDWYQPYPLVQVAQRQSWADVVAWALPLYPKVEALPDDLEHRIRQWRALPDRGQQLDAALRAVQNEIRYFGAELGENTHRPTPPAETWRRRYGDCKDKAYLLATVLARLDIRAEPALVSLGRGRAIGEFLPSASDFDHVIVRVGGDQGTIWVDPTQSQQGGKARDADLSGFGMALPLRQGVAALVPVAAPAGASAGIHAVERYEAHNDGKSLKFTVSTTYRGHSADTARRSIEAERMDDRSRRYADYYRKRYGDLDVVSAPVTEDDRQSNTLRIQESYLLKAPFQSQAGGQQSLEVYAEAVGSVAVLPPTMARTGPLVFGRPSTEYVQEIVLVAPASWKPRFAAEHERQSSSAFDYERTLSVKGNEATLRHRLDVKQPDVMPTTMGVHLEQMRKVRDGLSSVLRYELPAAQAGRQREERLKKLLRDVMEEDAQ